MRNQWSLECFAMFDRFVFHYQRRLRIDEYEFLSY